MEVPHLAYTDTFSRDHILDVLIYVIPVSVIFLELYFRALKKGESKLLFLTTAILAVFTFIMMAGIYGARLRICGGRRCGGLNIELEV